MDGVMVRERAHGRRMNWLSTTIEGAPYVGLFGTVIGIMLVFVVAAMAGAVDINSVAPGMAAALLCTAAGLGVAIPGAVRLQLAGLAFGRHRRRHGGVRRRVRHAPGRRAGRRRDASRAATGVRGAPWPEGQVRPQTQRRHQHHALRRRAAGGAGDLHPDQQRQHSRHQGRPAEGQLAVALEKPKTKAITIDNAGQVFLDAYPVTLPELEGACARKGPDAGLPGDRARRCAGAVRQSGRGAGLAAPDRPEPGRPGDRQAGMRSAR
jgi:hypothetical protein